MCSQYKCGRPSHVFAAILYLHFGKLKDFFGACYRGRAFPCNLITKYEDRAESHDTTWEMYVVAILFFEVILYKSFAASLWHQAMGQSMSAPQALLVECWTWYSVVIFVVAIRYVSQYMLHSTNSSKNTNPDDWIMLFTVCAYTSAITAIYLSQNCFAGLEFTRIGENDEVYLGRRLGTLVLLSETSMLTTLWGIKACLLIVYHRFTINRGHDYAIKIVSLYCILGYIAVIIALYYGWCRPFSEYFRLRPNNEQCISWTHYNVMQMIINISSDFMILIIPISLVLRTEFRLARKLMLCAVFSLGIFVIICAICTKYSVLNNPDKSVDWILWSIRESSMAVIVSNLLLCFPLARKIIATARELFGMEKVSESSNNVRKLGSIEESGGSLGLFGSRKREGSDAWTFAETENI